MAGKSSVRTDDPKGSTIRRRELHARRKAALIESLGGECVRCKSTENLTFDHRDGRDWEIRKVHSTKRLRIYQDEAAEGKIQLLCLSCNSSKKQTSNADFMASDADAEFLAGADEEYSGPG